MSVTVKRTSLSRTFLYFCYVFALLLMITSSTPFICISTAVCAALHEAAHVLCARAMGRRVRPISFSLTGLYPDLGSGSTLSCILIYAAGPAVNLLICAVCLWILHCGYSARIFELFCANAVLALYNLTPVPFSDGGGILRCAVERMLGARVGGAVCSAVELVFSFLFFVFFSFRFFYAGRGFFSFFCSFVFLLSAIQNSSAE